MNTTCCTLVAPWDPHKSHVPPRFSVVETRRQPDGLRLSWAFYWFAPGLVVVAVDLSLQLRPSHTHPVSAKAATYLVLYCSSQQVVPGRYQAVFSIDLCCSPSQEATAQIYPVAGLQQSTTWLAPQDAPSKRGFGRHQYQLEKIVIHGVSTYIGPHTTHSQPAWG